MDDSAALSPAAPRTFLFIAENIASQENDRHSASITSKNPAILIKESLEYEKRQDSVGKS
jgi:hypothetical protein